MDLLNDCVLEDQMVVDEKSEINTSDRKTKIDEFMNGHEEIMKEKGHCNDDSKLDGLMKAHYRRFFLQFDIIKHGMCDVNYFNIKQHTIHSKQHE